MMSSLSKLAGPGLVVSFVLASCGDDGRESEGMVNTNVATGIATLPGDSSVGTTGMTGATDGTATDPGSADSDPVTTTQGEGSTAPKFDLGDPPETTMSPDSGDVDCTIDPNQEGCKCSIPDHAPCDAGTQDPFNAMGLNCPGELQVNATKNGDGLAFGVRNSFGQAGVFNPREGTQYAVIGSGVVAELNQTTPGGDSNQNPSLCNDILGGSQDPGPNLPAPLKTNAVGGDCQQNPGLVGTGDCSSTVQDQFQQGMNAFDYTELRFVLQVPPGVVSLSYDFAFFSTEYPHYYGEQYNDMYIGWLESEKWTGNISFDAMGNPISLNAGFLDHKDDGGNLPALAGTCMRQHAGTNWLQTTAGVTPGETITVVFAVFDLYDPVLDSYVFLDNFKWGCNPVGKPQTMPPG
ncbi:MAG TPA: choice-of-anchor L domain-containing protein [Nannocystis sp.]